MKKIIIGIASLALLTSCDQVAGWFGKTAIADSTTRTLTSESIDKAKAFRDESITKENAYSDLFIDTAALENYIRTQNVPADRADGMRAFYLVRNNQFAWFASDGVTEQARGLWSLYNSDAAKGRDNPAAAIQKRMDSLLASDTVVKTASDTGTQRQPAVRPTIKAKFDTSANAADTAMAPPTPAPLRADDSVVLKTELALTAQLVQMAADNNGTITSDNFYWLVPRKKMDAMMLADSILHKQKDSLWQSNTAYTGLKQELQRYYEAAKAGGWPQLPSLTQLRKGAKSPAVVALKKRLAATGDYPASDTSNVFTDSLAVALRTVQLQFGLTPAGAISDSLSRQLNVTAEARVQQILVNMNRALWLPPKTDSIEISVNIPSMELVVQTDTGNVMRMPVIVGKEGTSTIAFSDKVTQVVFNPYWNIPQSIVRREIKPAMESDPSYLQKHHMEIVSQGDSLPQIRQLPGPDNALGQVKFLFPNSFDIYLHDTPDTVLFTRQNRALSHGCIRVAQPDSLARFILRHQPEWNPEKIAAAMKSGKEQKVDVKSPTAVAISYYTAWVDNKGRMNFRNDLYGYDKQTVERMFTSSVLRTDGSPA